MLVLVLASLLVGLLAAAASAQQGVSDDDGVIYQKVTHYNYQEDVIEGTILRPDTDIVRGRMETNFPTAIRLRENMKEKVLASVTNL
jgi:hypothetical protein